MTGNEKRSAAVGIGLLLALAVTYVLLFNVQGPDESNFYYLTVLLGLAYVTGYTRIVVPRRQAVTTFNIREASYSLLLVGGEPKYVIPLLLVLRLHQWGLTNVQSRFRLLTATTGLETILLHTWVFYGLGLLATPQNVTLHTVFAAAPFLAVSAFVSFLVFGMVHPARTFKETVCMVPVRVIVSVCVMSWVASLLGLLVFVPEAFGAHALTHFVGPFLLLGLAAVVTLQQFTRARDWSSVSKLVDDWTMSTEHVKEVLNRLFNLSPVSAQILLIEDRTTGTTYRAWTTLRGLRLHADVIQASLTEVLKQYPPSNSPARPKDDWNVTGARGWMTSATGRERAAVIQVFPPVQVVLLPTVPQSGETFMSLAAEAVLDQLARALRQYEFEYQANSGLAGVLRNLTEGFATLGDDGRIRSWNRAMERLTGKAEPEVIDTTLDDHLEEMELQVDEGDQPLLTTTRKDGSMVILHQTASCVEVNGKRETVHTFRDVSETIAVLESRNRFIAYVAHELKSPVTSLYLQVDELEERLGADDELVISFQYAAEQLSAYLTDMSTASEFASSPYSVSMHANVIGADRVLEFPWLDKTRELYPRIEVREIEHFTARIDVFRSQQVLINLVSNALKYSDSDTLVAIEYGVSHGSETGFFRVVDQGIGIPEAHRCRVFEPYFRSSNTADAAGTGLGLSLSRSLARQMGGDLTYESREGRGSVFTLHVPLHLKAQEQLAGKADTNT